jgi:hypothetical protein
VVRKAASWKTVAFIYLDCLQKNRRTILIRERRALIKTPNHSLLFPAFFALAHLALAAAESAALPAALNFLLGF